MLYIPQRFIHMVDTHILGNLLNVQHYPLIMFIEGKPGMGKTYQLREYLKAVDVTVISVSAADLESDRAGEPAKLLQSKYVDASGKIKTNNPAVLVIDDVDTTLGEWENHTGTVNHQDILAFLMHIADNPCFIENEGEVNRVPIFFTGNIFERLYYPLIREGRANHFTWEPTIDEKKAIVCAMFGDKGNMAMAEILVERYPDEKISFFANLIITEIVQRLAASSHYMIFKNILTDKDYKEKLYSQYSEIEDQVLREYIDNRNVKNEDTAKEFGKGIGE